jgi:CheY-like chemotaxis protein
MKLLVIEDSDDVRLLLEIELQQAGHEVVAAGNAERALEILRGDRPDVVVSDLGLPGMTGIDLIRQVRRSEGGAHLPAIALSGFGLCSERDDAVRAGYDAVLVKPVEPRALLAAIERVAAAPGASVQGTAP